MTLNSYLTLNYIYIHVVVHVDKAPNNIVFVCKSHYIDCLIKKLGIDRSLGNPTYPPTTFAKEEILDNLVSFVFIWNFKFQIKGRIWSSFILLDSKASQVFLQATLYCRVCQLLCKTSFHVTLSAVKIGLQSYCATSHSRSGVNQMWILKKFQRTVRMPQIKFPFPLQ